MWVFTKYGFYSAVCARQGPQGRGRVDPTRIMLRARVRSHLEALQERFPDLLGRYEIRQYAGSDYAYRIFVPKGTWARVLSDLASETDYDNFKGEVAGHQGRTAYEQALHTVWAVMNRLQERDAPPSWPRSFRDEEMT